MHLAIVDNIVSEAAPGLRGLCKCCGTFVIAKCGRYVAWHWAHSYLGDCDPWWETETAWHRNWKNNFPLDWQEVLHKDPATGDEKHIADVKTPTGIVVEFQHSPIKLEERNSRENFYKPMVWVVNGCRNDFDRVNFSLGIHGNKLPLASGSVGIRFSWYSRGKLPHNWCDTKYPVFFDFGNDVLWQLLSFDVKTKDGLVKPVSKTGFISEIKAGQLPQDDKLAPCITLQNT